LRTEGAIINYSTLPSVCFTSKVPATGRGDKNTEGAVTVLD
jgi:hypothetical protein